MTTVSKAIADKIIEGDGYYPGDRIKVVRIVKYQNQFNGADAYGLVYEGRNLAMYHESPACHNPEIYWEVNS